MVDHAEAHRRNAKTVSSSPELLRKTPEPASGPGKLLYSVNEVLGLLGFGRNTFYELLEAGDLKAVKIRKRTFVHVDEIHRFLSSLPTVQDRAQS